MIKDIRKFFSAVPTKSSSKAESNVKSADAALKSEKASLKSKTPPQAKSKTDKAKSQVTTPPLLGASNGSKHSKKTTHSKIAARSSPRKKTRDSTGGGDVAVDISQESRPEPSPTSEPSVENIDSVSTASENKTTKQETKSKEKTSWKDNLYDDDVEIDEDDSTEFKQSKGKSSSSKSRKERKKKTKKALAESEEDVQVLDISDEDDDSPIKATKSSKKKKGKTKKGTVIYDSDSGGDAEEPLPRKSRAAPRPRKRKTHGCLEDSDEEHQVSIQEAFAHAKPKKVLDDATPQKTLSQQKKSPAKKKLISAADFFGTGAVQQTQRATLAVKRKAESPVKKEEQMEGDDVEIHDDDDFEKTLAVLDEKQPNKKLRREDDTAEGMSTSSLASKLSAKKALQRDTFVAETPERDMASRNVQRSTERSPTKPEKPTSPVVTPKVQNKTPAKKTPPSKGQTPDKNASETPTLQRKGSQYRSYLHREGPRALGSKEIPEGAENCLEGLAFVITGVLESLERDEAKSLVERYGGKVTTSLSKKTSYIVIGRDPGESKTSKAAQLGTKTLDEDGLLNLIRTFPGKKSKYQIQAEKEIAKEKQAEPKTPQLSKFKSQSQKDSPKNALNSAHAAESSQSSQVTKGDSAESLLWVDKYKPSTMKQIIGQQGDKSNARKLLHWIQNWHKNIAAGKKPAFNRFNDDGSGHRAALLSGPPGVGKTTTSTIVCKEVGFSYVELNASDNRSKRSLKEEVSEALGNHTLVDYLGSSSQKEDGKKHCVIMDEVDGMAGNEDRGGMQELIQLIKTTKIPIICMCNDRNHPKVRSLSNYCFDLRFQRPRLEQIKSAMMSIAFKEGLKIPPPALNDVIAAANQDIRQVLNNLSMWTSKDKSLSIEQLKAESSKAKKDMHIGPFDVCRKVFVGGEETAHMTIHDKADLFFQDYSFGPLFVQENYINVSPYVARGSVRKHLEQLSKAADSLADGDLVGRQIRTGNNWSLLPTQAIYASVIPGEMMRGTIGGMIQFPQWLGKNSSTSKTERILSELRNHMCLRISSDKRSLNTDYLPHLRHSLTSPLRQEGQDGVRAVIDVMEQYDLLRDDVDGIVEITSWPGTQDPMAGVDSKVKASFTRTFNKESHMTPYAVTQAAKKSRRKPAADDMDLGEDGEIEQASEDDNDDDVTNDAMIKAKKKPAAKTTKTKPDTGKGKGVGKGKGKKK